MLKGTLERTTVWSMFACRSGVRVRVRALGWACLVLASGSCAGTRGGAATGSGGQGGSVSGMTGGKGGTGVTGGRGGSGSGGTSTTPCGNGMLDPPAEACDDGNQVAGDGCSPDCHTETDWICPTPGKPCGYTVHCGDGVVAGAETCDDRNTAAGDGCDGSCHLETGWTCPQAGARCVPRCGDGV
jgi:cysteine-rich repeat protein